MSASRVARIACDMIVATVLTVAIVGAVVLFVWSLYLSAGAAT